MKTTIARLKFPNQISKFVNNIESVEFDGERVIDLFEYLDKKYLDIKLRLFEEDGQAFRPYFNLFIGKRNINSIEGIYSVIPEGETVSLLLARAGG